MKKVFLICMLAINIVGYAQTGVGINTTGAAANSNAMLDVSATNKGLLAPRVNLVSLTGDVVTSFGISATPTTSLLVYNTTASAVFQTGFYFWDGSLWTKLNTGAASSVANAWSLTGNASTTASNYIGTTDALPLSLRTAGLDRMTLAANGNVGIGTTAPAKKLHIVSGGEAMRIEGTNNWIGFAESALGTYNGYLYQTAPNFILGTISGSTKNIQLSPKGIPALTAVPTGEIGIGTTTPNYKLHVRSDFEAIHLEGTNTAIGFAETGSILNGFIEQQTTSFTLGTAPGSTRNIQLSPKNFPALTVIPTGNVGIGTENPNDKLTVRTNPSNVGITHTDGTIKLSTYVGGPNTGGNYGGYFGTSSNHPFHLFTNGSYAQVTLLPNGNVGIGTTTPSQPLSFPAVLGKKISLYPGTTGDAGIGVFGSELRMFSDYNGADITFGYDHYSFGFTERMRVKGNGNVGIGTNNPSEKLVVNTIINKAGLAHTDGTIQVVTYLSNDTDFGGQIGTTSQHPLRFFAGNNFAEATLLPNGNFGIGTLNPSHKLSVNGTIRSKEVIVETGWADFVFDKKYKLPSLFEVEKYINENNHLPNIPSAEEIQTNGLKVGEVQTKMMQKIEELTLYVIELKKEIELLKVKK
jgi:hypothetical protein